MFILRKETANPGGGEDATKHLTQVSWFQWTFQYISWDGISFDFLGQPEDISCTQKLKNY